MEPVLYSTGFILPKTDSMSLINDTVVDDLVGGISDLKVYTSPIYSQALHDYFSHQTPAKYLNLVDLALECVKDVAFVDFAKLQIKNPHLSVTSWSFLMSVVNDDIFENYRMYSVVPNNAKIIVTKAKYDVDRRRDQLNDYLRGDNPPNWGVKMAKMADNQPVFLAFFQYLFVGI